MLHALVVAPFIAALIAGLVCSGGSDQRAALRWGVISSIAIALFGFFALGSGEQVLTSTAYPWFPLWGGEGWVHWSLRADALSIWLVHLSNVITPFVFLAVGSWRQDRLREFIIAALVMQGAIVGCFLAADIVLFYLFFEAMLIPVVFLVARQGDADRRGAALQFFITTMLSSVFMLVAIWYLALVCGTTDIVLLTELVPTLSGNGMVLTLCFFSFALAFAVKTPLVPFHSWQARIYAAAPAGASALIGAVMAKVGIYGFLRLVLPLFPEQLTVWSDLLLTLAVAGTILGALLALVQTDLKRLLAYASLGHLSLIMVGVLVRDETAFTGVVVQLVAHGLSVAASFLIIGALEQRRSSRGMGDFGGLASTSPMYALLLVASMLVAVAMPGTAAFAGEFLILLGVATASGGSLLLAAVVGLSLILTAAYLLRMTRMVVFGPPGESIGLPRRGEAWGVGVLLLLSVFLGFLPRLITEPVRPLANSWATNTPQAALRATTKSTLVVTSESVGDDLAEVEESVHEH